jgi:hypothetical protein
MPKAICVVAALAALPAGPQGDVLWADYAQDARPLPGRTKAPRQQGFREG